MASKHDWEPADDSRLNWSDRKTLLVAVGLTLIVLVVVKLAT